MEPKPGTKVTDKVTLVELLGQGAMGSVWRADHGTLQTQVAVKFISEEMVSANAAAAERFSGEATAAAQIRSPHVVQMIDHGVMDEGTPYIVMELLTGESLDQRIERSGTLSLGEVSHIVSQVVKALEAAHDLGVIHRDIKPHNIFLMDDQTEPFVKVLDFGIAKQTRLASSEELTEPGMIVGTPQYISRDVIMGIEGAGTKPSVDLWALAVVAYKCLTGALPFDGGSLGAICAALATGRFDPPSAHCRDLGPRVDAWFSRALGEDRATRFGSAAELGEAFRALLDEPEVSTSDPQPTSAIERRAITTLPMVVVFSMVLGIMVVLGLYTVGEPSGSDSTVGDSSALGSSTAASRRGSSSADGGPVSERTGRSAPGPTTTTVPSVSPSAVSSGEALQPGPNQVVMASGEVWMGCARETDEDCRKDETPGRTVWVDGFFIDRTEVTLLAYAECVIEGVCSDRRVTGFVDKDERFVPSTQCNWKQPGREHHPMNCVSHDQAQSYCEYMGLRLPTEVEWERAARGDDRRLYPWGDQEATCIRAVMADQDDHGCGRRSSWPAGAKRNDATAAGVLDMAGNMREWVADWYAADYYRNGPRRNPTGPEKGTHRVTRGGSWGSPEKRYLRTSARYAQPPRQRSLHVGFRCAGPLR